jgi:hypothetical protein
MISQKLQAIVAANGSQPLFPAMAPDSVICRAQGMDFRGLAAKYDMPGGTTTENLTGKCSADGQIKGHWPSGFWAQQCGTSKCVPDWP